MRRTKAVHVLVLTLSLCATGIFRADAEAPDLFSALSNGSVKVEVFRRDFGSPRTNSVALFVGPNTSGSEFLLTLRNQQRAPVQVALPKYLIASFPSKSATGAGHATNDYLMFVPAEFVVTLNGTDNVTKRIVHLFSLGKPDQRPPAQTDATLAVIKPVPYGSSIARLSDQLLKTDPPDPDRTGQVLFYIVVGTLSGQKLEDVLFSLRYSQVQRMKPVLRAVGLDTSSSFPFRSVEDKRESVLAQLKSGLNSPDLAGTTIANLPTRLLEGDVDTARAFVPYLARSADDLHRELVINTLEKLGVADKEVLGALFQCAISDSTERSRMSAALAAARLGDIRCIPILMQFLGNISNGDPETERIRGRCLWQINECRANGNDWIDGFVIQDLSRHGKIQNTPFKDLASDDLKILGDFLAGARNVHREEFERACDDAISAPRPRARSEALRQLAQALSYQTNERAIAILLDRLRNDADMVVRRAAVEELWNKRDSRITGALVDRWKTEPDPALKKEIWDYLEHRRQQKLDDL